MKHNNPNWQLEQGADPTDVPEWYILVRDDDAHWYVIPARRQTEWELYVEAATRYWDEMPDDQEPPTEPAWVERVGGAPSSVLFSEYVIE